MDDYKILGKVIYRKFDSRLFRIVVGSRGYSPVLEGEEADTLEKSITSPDRIACVKVTEGQFDT